MIRMPNKREEIIVTEHPFILRRKIRYNAAANAMQVIERQFPDLFIDQPESDSKIENLVSHDEVNSNVTTTA